ncbi:MAG TPA: hypothetical protein DDY49_08115 [Paenibacillaceae bacterium]|nr:hypothetical protein [Paenibacillaceae bacterium]
MGVLLSDKEQVDIGVGIWAVPLLAREMVDTVVEVPGVMVGVMVALSVGMEGSNGRTPFYDSDEAFFYGNNIF